MEVIREAFRDVEATFQITFDACYVYAVLIDGTLEPVERRVLDWVERITPERN